MRKAKKYQKNKIYNVRLKVRHDWITAVDAPTASDARRKARRKVLGMIQLDKPIKVRKQC